MQRTAGAEGDSGGQARTAFWDADEIGFAAQVIGAGAVFTSEMIHGEGYRHFHVYLGRSDGAIPLSVAVNVFRPFVQLGAPVLSGGPVVIGTWAALAGQLAGVFYFGEAVLLTDAQGRNFRYSPFFSVSVTNTGAAPVTVDVFVHMQD